MCDRRIENEVAHGRRITEMWSGTLWYWETPAGRLRWARRVKMLTGHLASGMNVLEIGCGMGYFTREIVASGPRVTAVDISPDLLKIARERNASEHVTFRLADANKMDFPDDSFDTIVGSAILHHLDIHKALKEFYRVLKPEGTIFFTEPNMLNPQIFLQKNVPLLKKWAGDSPDETAFFRWPLKRILAANRFTHIEITPFDFLHPATPRGLIFAIDRLGLGMERIPALKEIAGSLFIRARK